MPAKWIKLDWVAWTTGLCALSAIATCRVAEDLNTCMLPKPYTEDETNWSSLTALYDCLVIRSLTSKYVKLTKTLDTSCCIIQYVHLYVNFSEIHHCYGAVACTTSHTVFTSWAHCHYTLIRFYKQKHKSVVKYVGSEVSDFNATWSRHWMDRSPQNGGDINGCNTHSYRRNVACLQVDFWYLYVMRGWVSR